MDKIKAFGAIGASLVTAAILIWWLIKVGDRIGTAPTKDSEGNIVVDEWERAKDILLVLLPLFSASLAYWVGTQGETRAKKEADGAKKQLTAVLDAADPGVLEKAKSQHPQAF